jgi:hypothetical protein
MTEPDLEPVPGPAAPTAPAPLAQIVGAAATPPASPQASEPAHAASDVLKPAVALFANVTVITALLVYFGWRRAETHADRLGIDESVLGMSTREYVLRSVGPVLVLLVGVAVCGLVWTVLERRLTPLLRTEPKDATGGDAPEAPLPVRLAVHVLGLAWVILPGLVYLLGFVSPGLAFVLFPASIGAGALLWVYAGQFRRHDDADGDRPEDERADGRSKFALAFVGLLVLVCLFWTASNDAQLLGHRLADDFVDQVDTLPGVVVLSQQRLFLAGPGVDEDELAGPDADGALHYRYEGLRLLEHTGGRYFLVSDGWSPTYGVVFVLQDGDDTMRLDFVRDRR